VPTGNFHIASAGITVMIVMEMGTIDRLFVKGFLRAMGTLIGSAQAVAAIYVVEGGRNEPAVVFVAISLVTVTNATLQILKAKQGYMFLASNITFVFVFYGYFQEGAGAVVNRVTSVFIAVGIALLVDLVWPLVWLDDIWFSTSNVLAGTEKVLRKTFAIIDFTFVHDEILAQEGRPEMLALTLWKDRLFLPETIDFFHMRRADITLGELQDQLGKNAHGKRIANETEISQLHAAAKSACEDIAFTYWLFRRVPPHNYQLLFERLHAVYAQACSLSHMAYSSLSTSGRALWHSSSEDLESLRGIMCSLEPPMLRLLRFCHEDKPEEVDAQVSEIVDLLEQAVKAVNSALQGVQTCCKQDRWRFEAFLMTVDLLVAELSIYVRKLTEHFGTLQRQSSGPAPDDSFLLSDIASADLVVHSLSVRLSVLSRHTDM